MVFGKLFLITYFIKNILYTVGHKKTCNFIWDHNSHVRGGFLHFLHQWKQEEILYWGITKFATLHNCVSTLPEKI